MINIWERISHIGVKKEMTFNTKRRIILLNRISITLFFIVLTLRTVVFLLGLQQFSYRSIFPFIGIFAILLIPYYNSKGYYKINAFVLSIITPLCFLFFSVIAQTANNVVNINHYYVPRLFILSTIVLPLILINPKHKIFLYIAILVNVICILSFDIVVKYFGVPFNHETVDFQNYEAITRIMLLPVFLMIAAFLFLTKLNRTYESEITGLNSVLMNKNKELEQSNEEVTAQRDMITFKNELLEQASSEIESINSKLTDSIVYAENIQRAVLFKEQLPAEYFSDNFIFFKPKAHVSGDFYYYKKYSINTRKCIIVAAADCTGHGVPGGFLSMLGMTHLNETLQNESIKNAADVLNHLRDRVKKTLNQTGEFLEQKDGMDMALCIYYPDTKELDYAGARNPLCIIDNKKIKTIKGDRQPIGIHLKENDFTNHHIQLSGGEMIYLFSDGLQDQFGGTEGKKLKLVNLQKKLQELSSYPCVEQKQQIQLFLKNWTKNSKHEKFEQVDDIVLVGMRV